MSDVPEALVEKAVAVLDDAANAGFALGCVGPTMHGVAAAVLAAVLPDVRRAVAEEAIQAAADEAEATIADGDVAEVAAPVPGEVNRSKVVAKRDALYEEPAQWLRDNAARIASEATS